MNRRTSIAAGAALALLASIVVWSMHSCRPQKESVTVAERPAAEAPRPILPPGGSDGPKAPASTQPAAPPQPPGPRPVIIRPAQKTRSATAEHCWLVRITDATREASITPAPCAHFDGVDPGGVPR